MPDVRMPDGTIVRNVPAHATREQIAAAHARAKQAGAISDERPTSFWRGAWDEGMKAVSNIGALSDVLSGQDAASRVMKAVTGHPMPTPSQRFRADRQAESDNSKYQGSTAGHIVGGIAATVPTMLLPGGAIAQGAYGGALLSEDASDPLKLARDATIGAAAGKVGELAGKYVVAPIANRIGRTAPVQAVRNAVTALAPRIKLPTPQPRFVPIDRAALRAAPKLGDARNAAADAARLKLPFSPADADPRLQQLAGSVARYSPEGRALAEQNFNQRGLDQADRAVKAIDEHLAPVTDIEQRAADIIEQGRHEFGPLYDKAYANPPIVSPRLMDILNTPAAREATGRAKTIAANEFRNPVELGFVLNKDGHVVLNPASITLGSDEAGNLITSQEPLRQAGYSTQTLDYVKRGLDDLLEQYRDPVTNKLKLDEAGRAINGVKNGLLKELDTLNPDYGAARAAYQRYASQASALRTGHDVLPQGNLPQRNFDRIVGRATDETLPELQRGHATAMADTANRFRLSNDPYKAVYGSTDQQGKVAALFPKGADDFRRTYDLEQTMAQTRQKALGGSQTQANKVSDDQFLNNTVANAVDAGLQVASGGVTGGVKLASLAARKAWSPSLGFMAERKATAMAPQMFDTDAAATLAFFNDLQRKQAEEEARKLTYRKAGGLFGTAAGVGAGAGLFSQ